MINGKEQNGLDVLDKYSLQFNKMPGGGNKSDHTSLQDYYPDDYQLPF